MRVYSLSHSLPSLKLTIKYATCFGLVGHSHATVVYCIHVYHQNAGQDKYFENVKIVTEAKNKNLINRKLRIDCILPVTLDVY
jgi:hypothetical protein